MNDFEKECVRLATVSNGFFVLNYIGGGGNNNVNGVHGCNIKKKFYLSFKSERWIENDNDDVQNSKDCDYDDIDVELLNYDNDICTLSSSSSLPIPILSSNNSISSNKNAIEITMEKTKILCLIDFHIIYSSIYQVPVLYFHGVDVQSGSPLSINQLKKCFTTEFNDNLSAFPLSFATSVSGKLLRLVEDGDTEGAIELIKSGEIDVNEGGSAAQTALHDAAAQGYTDVVEALIEAGANVNASDEDGMKPLHNAARKGHEAIVKKLLDARANVNDINTDGLTALHFASHRGHVRVVEILLASNARVTAADNYEDLPIHFAASEGHTDVIRMLLTKGSPICPQTNRGNTPLHLAAMKGKIPAVRLLLERGAIPEIENFGKLTAAQVAENKGELATSQAIKQWVEEDEQRKKKLTETRNAPPVLQTSESEMHLDPGSFISPLTTELAPIQRGMSTMDLSDTASFCITPAPPGTVVQGKIKREKSKEGLFFNYHLQDAENTFLVTSVRRQLLNSNFPITTNRRKLDRKDPECIGKLRGNVARTEYVIYDNGENPKHEDSYRNIRKELGAIFYSEKYPREITALIPAKKANSEEFEVWQPRSESESMLETYRASRQRVSEIWVLKNKAPTWFPDLNGYVLDFYGRVTKKSSKNFQLTYADKDKEDKVLLLFGRVSKDEFTLDYQYPLTCLQAYGIALTAFDTY